MAPSRRAAMVKATKLKGLTKRRANILGAAAQIEHFNIEYQPTTSKDQIVVRLQHLEKLWTDFNDVQEEIELLENEDAYNETRSEFQDNYYSLKGSLQAKLEDKERHGAGPSAVNVQLQQPTATAAKINLPELKLPEFSGLPEEWSSFHDLFQSIIHTNDALSSIQKLHYLKACLKKEAARIISTVEMTSDNYVVAWKLVCERFSNKHLRIKGHIGALFAIAAVKKENHSHLSELADEFERHVTSLNKLGTAEAHWNSVLVETLSRKLDHASQKEWETQCKENPQFDDLLKFIRKKARILQTLNMSNTCSPPGEKPLRPKMPASFAAAESNYSRCAFCRQAHPVCKCESFLALTPKQRFDWARKAQICLNCLKGSHLAKDCNGGSCRRCSKKHHTLLHLEQTTATAASSSKSEQRSHEGNTSRSQPQQGESNSSSVSSVGKSCPSSSSSSSGVDSATRAVNQQATPVGIIASSTEDAPNQTSWSLQTVQKSCAEQPSPIKTQIMLSTALVKVRDANNKFQNARVLLDSGSQPSFISEALCQKLNLRKEKVRSPVSGIGQTIINTQFSTTVTLASRFGEFQYNLDCLVLPRLTISLPSTNINIARWKIPNHLPLADPKFNVSQGVDMIVGAELFFSILEQHQIVLATGLPLLQKTVFGYIVCGKISEPDSLSTATLVSLTCTNEELDAQLEKFWEVEGFENGKSYTTEEQQVEEHFQKTVARNKTGRYIVRLPLRSEMIPLLSNSYHVALNRLLSMERKFKTNIKLEQAYKQFMEEYATLSHMEECNADVGESQFFLPHHAISRPESTTTKTRVVFDGTCKGSNQLCINDLLYCGPTVQPLLVTIVINFRRPKYAVTADIEKMFRQILVHPMDRRFQQILWRSSPVEPVRIYQLKTVTYGLASSPFHATRVLNQLATDEGDHFPLAVPVIWEGTYVDDILTGHDNLNTLAETCRQLMQMLNLAGFVPRKWATNNPAVIASIPRQFWETEQELEIDRSPTIKTLGLLWSPQSDTFQFKVPILPILEIITKRIVVSEMSQLFDPLGLLGPVVVKAKMFVQVLWSERLSWDDHLSNDYTVWWKTYRSELNLLQSISVPRRVVKGQQYDLHCFCDASKNGYGCCIYVVSTDDSGDFHSQLLTAKSRVAPLQGLTIPRLELCAALLGSQLVDSLRKNTKFTRPAIMWTDSSVVLHWIKSPSNKWKVFVSNRVAEIQRLSKGLTWRHISSELNPADLISRGLLASEIINNHLWWHGPEFLLTSDDEWPQSTILSPGTSEMEIESRPLVALVINELDSSLFDRYSELAKLIRVVAWCYRFYNNCKLTNTQRKRDQLNYQEYDSALKVLVRLVQSIAFPLEMKLLQKETDEPTRVDMKSPLKNLNLFMDGTGIIRISGRLGNMDTPYDTRFPMLLPAKHHFSWLIAKSLHIQTLHAGPSLVLATMRQRFWPLRGRQLARKVVKNCVTCFRCKPKLQQQIMAPLPSSRIRPARPFFYSGMDYCGPFLVRPLVGRGASRKVYVALFVCMVVKAVHLEVVYDLTSVSCINAIKRVVARRGRIAELHCDNATTFVGADRAFRELHKEFNKQFRSTEWENYCLEAGINFRFIPARTPHFGGLWEAGVKSFKHHFRRIMGNQSFNIDQLLTAVTQIESILNSRPLSPITTSPEDFSALTPGHFLIGEPLFSIPEPDLSETKTNNLTRLQEMKRSVQHLWRRWSSDYVCHLLQRTKWKKIQPDVAVGQLVIIKQDNVVPMQWPLGRIVETITGKDGRIRVVVVKTALGLYKRGITEIAVLPQDTDAEGEQLKDNIKKVG